MSLDSEAAPAPKPQAQIPAKAVEHLRDLARLTVALAEGQELLADGDAARVSAVAGLYWRAATHGWDANRHARVYFLELFEAVPAVLRLPFEQLPAPAKEGVQTTRAMFERDCSGAMSAADEDRDCWFAFWLFYPDPARRLTSEELVKARRAFDGEEPNKWFVLAEMFERIGLGAVKHSSLASDHRLWRRLKARSHVSGEVAPEKENPAQ